MTNSMYGLIRSRFWSLCGMLILVLLIVSCGSGGDSARPPGVGVITYKAESCDLIGQQKFIHRVMRDTYFWYQEVPEVVDYASFTTVEELLDFLRYFPEIDDFSFITSAEQFQSFFQEGQYIGVGFSFLSLADDRLVTRFVYPETPAARAGMVRGDEVITINGQTIKEINDTEAWDTIFGADEIGVRIEMEIKHLAGNTETLSLEKDLISIKSVLHSDVIEQNNRKIGYLVFNSFIGPASAELAMVFADFTTAGIDELVLDLRYNAGGRVDIAGELASYIYGNNSGSETLANFKHNNQHLDWNWFRAFQPGQLNALKNLQRVFVLTQPGTCSASELIINGLQPFMEVIQIGESTCGKPAGMYGHEFCGKRIQPIEFEITNHNDEGGYYDGLPPVCITTDDPFQSFGAFDENLLSATLSYIHNGVCPLTPDAARMTPGRQKDTQDLYQGFRREIGAF